MTTKREVSKAVKEIRSMYGDNEAFKILINAMLMLEEQIESLESEVEVLKEILEEYDLSDINILDSEVVVSDCTGCVCDNCEGDDEDCEMCRFGDERCRSCGL